MAWGRGALPDFLCCSLFPVQQTTSGIGHRVKSFFRVGNQYAECERQLADLELVLRSRRVVALWQVYVRPPPLLPFISLL